MTTTARISERAKIGNNVKIGDFSIVHDNVTLGDNTTIGAFCEIGVPTPLADQPELIIGENATIRSHSVIYAGSKFAAGLVTGHRVTIRENISAGPGLQVGTLSDLQGNATFGDYVKFHSNVHICQGSKVGNYVWIFPYVVLTNDPHPPSEVLTGPTLGDFSVVATMSTVLPDVKVGEGALIGAHTLVSRDVPAYQVCVGVPGKVRGDVRNIKHTLTGEPAYPWPRHFQRGYPDDVIERWQQQFSEE